jgi:hypothetical protein
MVVRSDIYKEIGRTPISTHRELNRELSVLPSWTFGTGPYPTTKQGYAREFVARQRVCSDLVLGELEPKSWRASRLAPGTLFSNPGERIMTTRSASRGG